MAITKVSAALADLDGAVVINESSADVDFRVESNGNANMLFVDGGNDKIGIGTNAPAEQLHILGDSAKAQIESNGSDTGVQLVLDGAKTSNGAVGDIVFENAGDSVAMIRANRTGANDAADMLFYTQVASGSNAEKMRITSGGNIGFGITAPTFATGTGMHFADDKYIGFGTGNGTRPDFTIHGDNNGLGIACGTGADTTDVLIDTSGNVGIGGTIAGKFTLNHDGDVGIWFQNDGTTKWNITNDTAGSPGGNSLWIGDVLNDNGVYLQDNGSSWQGISDERLKRNWTNITNATDKIKTLTKVGTFERRGKTTGNWSTEKEVGLSAQEVEAILPEAVHTGGDIEFASDDKVTGVKGMAYEKLVPLLVKSIQELEARIATLEG